MKIDQIEKILKLRAQRHTHHQISVITGCCTRTVGRVLLKYAHEFALHEADVMEITYEKSGVGPNARAYYEAAYLKRIEKEFSRRPLSDVPTPTLAKMVIAARKRSDIYQDRVKRNSAESMLHSEEVIFTDEDEQPIREPQQDTRTGSAKFAGTHQPPTPATPQPQASPSSFVPSVMPPEPEPTPETSPERQPAETTENAQQTSPSSNQPQPNPYKTNTGNGIPRTPTSQPQNAPGYSQPINPGPDNGTPKPNPGSPR